jgi:Fe-S-cluster containining protein
LEGYKSLDRQKRLEIKQRAFDVCRKTEAADKQGAPARFMCPLNEHTLCLTYEIRPMICRLHGIPHEFHGSDGMVMTGRGCNTFHQRYPQKALYTFDRTSFYLNMANLERELKRTLNIPIKIKMTIAQMIVSYS